MPRHRLYRKPRRAQIKIEDELLKAAHKKAKQLGLRGGFSEYVQRLLSKSLRLKPTPLP